MRNLMFDYGMFFNELKGNPDKQEKAVKYEEVFGSQKGLKVEDQSFYKEYISQFSIPFLIAIPNEGDHDWDLLICLIFGSFSSEYALVLEDEWKKNPRGIPMVQISITAQSGDQTVRKTIDELSELQILRLFEIYILEQMDLAVLKEKADDDDKEEMEAQREEKLSLAMKRLTRVAREAKVIISLKQLIPEL